MKSLLTFCAIAILIIHFESICKADDGKAYSPDWGVNKSLDDGFEEPDKSFRPHTFWHWMNGHICWDGITDDLEAKKSVGLSGFMLWNTSEGISEGPIRYMSEQWWDLLEYTISESKRLGLEMAIFNAGSWATSGGPWQASFQSGMGAPEHIMLDSVICLTKHGHYDVKHYSGRITYHTDLIILPDMLVDNQHMTLNLGDVQLIAEVWMNGDNLGVLWKPTFAVDVTKYLQPGNNRLEIRVANSWVNRLIGDRSYPDDSEWTTKTGSTARGMGLAHMPNWVVNNTERPSSGRKAFVACKWPHLEDKELLPSGLIGPKINYRSCKTNRIQ